MTTDEFGSLEPAGTGVGSCAECGNCAGATGGELTDTVVGSSGVGSSGVGRSVIGSTLSVDAGAGSALKAVPELVKSARCSRNTRPSSMTDIA